MNVKELFDLITANKSYEERLIGRTYIPFSEKIQIVEAIIDTLTYRVDGMLTFDTNELEMMKFITFVEAYTNLKFDNDVADYDFIMENTFDALIINAIGEDYYTLSKMLDNQLKDIVSLSNSLEAITNRKLGAVVSSLTELINNVNDKIQDADVKELSTVISNGIKDILNTSV